jgi:hypothetical protein
MGSVGAIAAMVAAIVGVVSLALTVWWRRPRASVVFTGFGAPPSRPAVFEIRNEGDTTLHDVTGMPVFRRHGRWVKIPGAPAAVARVVTPNPFQGFDLAVPLPPQYVRPSLDTNDFSFVKGEVRLRLRIGWWRRTMPIEHLRPFRF